MLKSLPAQQTYRSGFLNLALSLVLSLIAGCAGPSASPTAAEAASTAYPLAQPTKLGSLLAATPGESMPLLLVRPGLAAEQIARTDWFELAPDSCAVALVSGFPNTITVLTLADLTERQVYGAPAESPLVSDLTWSPDGKRLLFGLSCPGCPASQDPGVLWSLDLASGSVNQLARSGGYASLFSPNSRWIAIASPLGTYVSHGALGIWRANGNVIATLFEFYQILDRAWAADSASLLAAVSDSRTATAKTGIWWIPIQGEQQLLFQLPDVSEVLFQPGGDWLVFRHADPEQPLYLANRSGTVLIPIPGSNGFSPLRTGFPAWSDDGQRLLLVNTRGEYAVLDVNNLNLETLAFSAVYGWVAPGIYLAAREAPEHVKQYEAGEDVPIEVLLCSASPSCLSLGNVSRLARIAYVSPQARCEP